MCDGDGTCPCASTRVKARQCRAAHAARAHATAPQVRDLEGEVRHLEGEVRTRAMEASETHAEVVRLQGQVEVLMQAGDNEKIVVELQRLQEEVRETADRASGAEEEAHAARVELERLQHDNAEGRKALDTALADLSATMGENEGFRAQNKTLAEQVCWGYASPWHPRPRARTCGSACA